MAEPEIAQKMPYVQKTEPGTYDWCQCGRSQQQPFCDGSHAGSEFSPVEVTITEEKNVAWCGCKRSANGAFCDGTHSSLS